MRMRIHVHYNVCAREYLLMKHLINKVMKFYLWKLWCFMIFYPFLFVCNVAAPTSILMIMMASFDTITTTTCEEKMDVRCWIINTHTKCGGENGYFILDHHHNLQICGEDGCSLLYHEYHQVWGENECSFLDHHPNREVGEEDEEHTWVSNTTTNVRRRRISTKTSP